MERLDKIIANQFCVSRSIARRDIKRGDVTVDGRVVKDFGTQIDISLSAVTYHGQALDYKKHIYLVMNKPKGVISASADKSKKTVVDLVPEKLRRQNLGTVGRLDKDTTGLLLLTDDGDFAHNVISPKSGIEKTYEVLLDGIPQNKDVKLFAEGITLADDRKCLPAKLQADNSPKARITIFEGKYHQVKRMFGVIGLGVEELKRVSIGAFLLPDDLAEGECRELTEYEKSAVLMSATTDKSLY